MIAEEIYGLLRRPAGRRGGPFPLLLASPAYACCQYDYCEEGPLHIDNNASERAIRGIAVGRRNWLFCGSNRGGHTAAVHFSLIASFLRRQLDPFAYLRDIFTRLPVLLAANPSRDQLRALLPDRWTAP